MSSSFLQVAEFMKDHGWQDEEISRFKELYQGFLKGRKKKLNWSKISSPSPDQIIQYDDLEDPSNSKATKLLDKLVVCKLNGGLGSSMGCTGPKSAIEVRDGLTFLDLIVEQTCSFNQKYNSKIPLVLMNSFNTDDDTQKIIKKYSGDLKILTFMQNQMPRIRKASLLPLSKKNHPHSAYYPPGHGDFYNSFMQSGLLEQLIGEGKEWAFIGNADNLGSSIDLKILNYMAGNKIPFIMEVTPKTRADIKGGTLVKTPEGPLNLLEIAQVPANHKEDFKSVKKFQIFNTNNCWINLKVLKEKIDQGEIGLDVVINPKTVDGIPVLQLETALGGAINCFQGSKAISVPRRRFLPVKKTDDLLLVQSNLFDIENGILVRNKERGFNSLPLIRLGEKFAKYDDYLERFESIPDILDLDLLTVVGDVNFGKQITLKGNVILVSQQGSLHIPRGSIIENKVLTGSIEVGEL